MVHIVQFQVMIFFLSFFAAVKSLYILQGHVFVTSKFTVTCEYHSGYMKTKQLKSKNKENHITISQ